MPDYLALDALPENHPQFLVVKSVSTETMPPLAAAWSAGLPLGEAVRNNGGLARLARHEHDGEIAGVFPIDGPDSSILDSPRAAGALSTLASQAMPTAPDYAATLVQVAPTVDVRRLITDLNDDPQVAFASSVPARYAAVSAPLGAAIVDDWSYLAAVGSGGQGHRLTWNLDRIGLGELSAQGYDDASGVRVGVLDTGVDDKHPALQGLVSRYTHGSPAGPMVSGLDVVGHGTHVCGVINSRYQPGLGCRGISQAELRVWKIFDDQPDYARRAGLYWYMLDPVLYRSSLADAVDKTDVINLSIGGPARPDPQEAALFQLLLDRGVCVVAAMGNERSMNSPTSYPAAIPGVIAVGATTSVDEVAAFSNAGDHIALAAPGASILSTMPTYPGQIGYRPIRGDDGQLRPGTPFPRDTSFASQDGTSMASPHVAAAAALILANSSKTRTPQEIGDLLRITAAQVPGMAGSRWTHDYGYGRLQLVRAVFAARHL